MFTSADRHIKCLPSALVHAKSVSMSLYKYDNIKALLSRTVVRVMQVLHVLNAFKKRFLYKQNCPRKTFVILTSACTRLRSCVFVQAGVRNRVMELLQQPVLDFLQQPVRRICTG